MAVDATDTRIRKLLDAALAEPLSEEDWGFLVLEGTVARLREAMAGERRKREAEVEAAARTIRHLRAAQAKPVLGRTEPARRMAPEEGERRYALSRLLALEAEEDEAVRGFRETYLSVYPGSRLPWEKIGDWIASQTQKEGPPTEFAPLALTAGVKRTVTPEGLKLKDDTPLSEARIENDVRSRILSYGLPGAKWAQQVAVRAGGVLDELSRLGERLVERYGWKDDQATVFVLTGVTPYLVGIRLETEYTSACPAASRIKLVIDPVVPPQEVLATYTRLRQRILGGRYRPLSPKHLRLAVFSAEEKKPGTTWTMVMERWNAQHPDESYTHETIFARDAAAARKRLLSPRLNPDGLLELVAEEEKRAT